MTGYHLAQLNIGRPQAPLDSPDMSGFMALQLPVNALADAAPGFVWRLRDEDGPGSTGFRPCGPDILVNMSVWETLEALRDFVYRTGEHLEPMRKRRQWFQPMGQPSLVLWWVPAGHIPSLDEALARLDVLKREGPGPMAFTFREPFSPPPEPPPPAVTGEEPAGKLAGEALV